MQQGLLEESADVATDKSKLDISLLEIVLARGERELGARPGHVPIADCPTDDCI